MSDQTYYGKLVRDNIPEIIATTGKIASTRTLTDKEFRRALVNKLQEEVNEFIANQSVEELADITEVIKALLEILNESEEHFEEVRAKKSKKNGVFKKRIWLETVK